MKKLLLILTAVLSLIVAHGQTNVSGGIFSNTTWTKVNSPYIVTDTVVVFQGITLTIQPGVIVKFDDNVMLEIRQARLIAVGTAVDSITFTSNSPSPVPGSWGNIWLNDGTMTSQFNYCNFRYATFALQCNIPSVNGFVVKNCNAMFNKDGLGSTGPNSILDSCDITNNTGIGVYQFGSITNCNISKNYRGVTDGLNIINCVIDSNTTYGVWENFGTVANCKFRNNGTGIRLHGGSPITMNNCIVTNNQVGIENQSNKTITNCIIDSNLVGISNGPNGNPENNNINNCYIRYNGTGIYDDPWDKSMITKNIIENNTIGIDLKSPDSIFCNKICNSTSYALKYTGTSNTNCVAYNYWCTPDSASTRAIIYDGYVNVTYGLIDFMPIGSACLFTSSEEILVNLITISPNPFSTSTTLQTNTPLHNATLTLYNSYGQEVMRSIIPGGERNLTINRGNLPGGLYFVLITSSPTLLLQEKGERVEVIATEKIIITDN